MKRRSLVIVWAALLLSVLPAMAQKKGATGVMSALTAQVRELVLKHYPKATVTRFDNQIRFEYNTRKFMVHEPLKTGEWQDAREETGPNKGGILGEIELRDGVYNGQAAVPQSFDKRYFVLTVMAPYSKRLDKHLYVHLYTNGQTPKEFLTAFDKIMRDFEGREKAPK